MNGWMDRMDGWLANRRSCKKACVVEMCKRDNTAVYITVLILRNIILKSGYITYVLFLDYISIGHIDLTAGIQLHKVFV